MSPAIGLSYTTRISPDIFTEFERLVAAEGLDLHLEQRDEDGPFAALSGLSRRPRNSLVPFAGHGSI
jgi:hypothetical protein